MSKEKKLPTPSKMTLAAIYKAVTEGKITSYGKSTPLVQGAIKELKERNCVEISDTGDVYPGAEDYE